MTVINTNVGALTARTYAVKATANTETAMERLSSGLRINSAADDAAGLAVANKMESQLRGMNMAIRNSQDGISLVQTAEAAMGEINNMAIRMRELAVQMNNGVYTDSDRANAQLEVTALLAEIDKIANNAAFNEVKILDGTYSQDIRAGNTNPEIINVTVDRMNTDSLGGANLAGTSSVATGNNSTDINSGGRTSVDVTEAANVTIKQTSLGSELQTFASTYSTDGAYSLGSNAPAGWTINSSGEISKSNVSYDTNNSSNNTVTLEVTYTGKASAGAATQTFKDTITVNIQDNTAAAVVKSATSEMTSAESANLSFRSVDSIQPVAATDGQLSAEMQNFVSADSYGGTWELTGTDAGEFSIDANGVVTASKDRENATGGGTDANHYVFNVVYTSSTGDKFTEGVTLEVTDGAEETHTLVRDAGYGLAQGRGSTYAVTVDGQTLTGTKTTTGNLTTAQLADALNGANDAASTRARGTFSAVGNDLRFTYDDSLGDFSGTTISDVTTTVSTEVAYTNAAVIALGATGIGGGATQASVDARAQVQTLSGISGVLNSAANGDSFEITVAGASGVINTGALSGITASNNYSVADLAADLTTANQALATPGLVTFTAVNDTLVITNTVETLTSAVNASGFTWNDGGVATSVGSMNTTTNGRDGVAEAIAIDTGGLTLTNGDTLSMKVGGTTFTSTIGGSLAATVTALDTALGSAYTATVINTDEIQIEAAVTGSAGDFDVEEVITLAATTTAFANAVAATVVDGDTSNAYAGATHDAARVGTYTPATADLNGNFGTRTSTETSSAKNTITLTEASTVKFGTDAMSAAMQNYTMTTGNTGGTYSLSGTDKTSFEINANTGLVENKVNMDFETKASYSFNVVYTDKNGDTFTDEVTLNLTNSTTDDVQHIADVDMSTQGGASSAIGILDSAINQISASQAKLGAIQNRLEHNIDNLSMASMLTETSKGRIIDADFAAETSELSKQQILAQAATSMLAQANQSKQGVLALLQ